MKVGEVLARETVSIQRVDLVMYAGASGDFNPIHWNEPFAKQVGLPDVIAHGMYTQAQLGRLVCDLAGDPGRVLSFSVRFSSPVVVPQDGGASLEISAAVAAVDADIVTLELHARSGGADVVQHATARIRVG